MADEKSKKNQQSLSQSQSQLLSQSETESQSQPNQFPSYKFFQDSNYDFYVPLESQALGYEAASTEQGQSQVSRYEATHAEQGQSQVSAYEATFAELRQSAVSADAATHANPGEFQTQTQVQSYDAPYEIPDQSFAQADAWPPTDTQINSQPTETFSQNFNFEASLMKVFWRIDLDRNNRVSRLELMQSQKRGEFSGDEEQLIELLLAHFEEITSGSLRLEAGLSVEQILRFGPFARATLPQ